MNRIETIEKIKTCQERIDTIDKMLSDVDNYYLKSVNIFAVLDTQQHHSLRKYSGEHLQVRKGRFIEFMKSEKDYLEERMKELIKELTKGVN
jgi:hypothetical protein